MQTNNNCNGSRDKVEHLVIIKQILNFMYKKIMNFQKTESNFNSSNIKIYCMKINLTCER